MSQCPKTLSEIFIYLSYHSLVAEDMKVVGADNRVESHTWVVAEAALHLDIDRNFVVPVVEAFAAAVELA